MKVDKFTAVVGIILIALAAVSYAQDGAPDAEAEVSVAVAEGVPGGVIVNTVEIKAKVVAIDHEARTAELLLPGGVVEAIQVGPEAINFDQIKKGDMVVALVTDTLVVRMGSADAELGDGESITVMAAAPGEQPGVIAADTVRMTAVVAALDGLMRTATLVFEDGSIRTVPVRDDIDLTKHRLGEEVVFESTQMVAISVEKQ